MSNDSKTTYLGAGVAALIAAGTYMQTAGDFNNPMTWVGLALAVLMGIKGYYANKPDAVYSQTLTKTVTVQANTPEAQ